MSLVRVMCAWCVAALVVAGITGASSAALALEPAPDSSELRNVGTPGAVTGVPGQGVVLTTEDNRLSMNIRGRVQARATAQQSQGELLQRTEIRTARLFVQGHLLWPELRYVTQLAFGARDFEPGSSTPLFDAFLESSHLRDANIQVGQFLVPFDRARTTRAFALQLTGRSLVVQELTLDRDVGIALSSRDLFGTSGAICYRLGVFGGDGRNRTTRTGPGMLYVARVGVKPLGGFDDDHEGDVSRNPQPRLSIGVAGAYNQNSDRQRSTNGPHFILGGTDYLHGAVDVVFKMAGFSLLTEALVMTSTTDARVGSDAMNQPIIEHSRSGWGYLVQAGMMVSDKVELAGRWGHMGKLGDTTDAHHEVLITNKAHELTFGSNYFLNSQSFKVQFDTGMRWGQWQGRHEYVARLQLDASF